MSAEKSYDEGFYLFNLQKEIERLGNLCGLMWPKEKRNLQNFGLKDGMSVLEVGSGPGFFTERLATLVPNGSITCVEPNPAYVKHANEYLKGKVKSRLQILETTGEAVELPENSFDFAIVRLLFQHIGGHVELSKKILRLLKPGGRFVITDIDGDMPSITVPTFPEILPVMAKVNAVTLQNKTDLTVGRNMWNILKHAGFVDLDLDSLVLHTGSEGARAALPQFSPTRLEPMVKMGLLTESELQLAKTTFDRFLSDPDGFYMRVMLMGCGRKPGG